MARFFIDRPVFAIVIAIVMVLLGAVAIPSLPIAAFPEVVPPVVQITATYLGGNALDLEKTVAQPIEQQLVGLDGLLYFLSTSANNGQLTISATFALGTDPDMATVQTQNRVSVALPQLPPEVQRQGVVVKKVSTAFLMAVSLSSKDDRYDELFLANYAQINLVNQLGSLLGVGESRLASANTYAMRVWVNPDRMASHRVTTTDIANAIQAQNRQNPAGAIGQAPAPAGTAFQYAVAAPGRLIEPSQFADIIIRGQQDASLLRIKDVGRVELGSQNYNGFSRLNARPSANVILYLSPGANAVETAARIRDYMTDAARHFPEGITYEVPYDSTMFVRTAIKDVVITLLEAILLVVMVVFLFLQNWRATLIPLMTVPVAVFGTFALFPLLGFSINITSMFGLVLAIGIVVDDSIVVVEAIQRHIDDGMSPRDAAMAAIVAVSGPGYPIAQIRAAGLIPVGLRGGFSGQIYRQFAVTIAVSVLLSAFNALSLSPALGAMILKPKQDAPGPLRHLYGGFNRLFNWTTHRYMIGVAMLIRRSAIALTLLVVVWLGTAALFRHLPSGFLPDEDQGVFFVAVRLPDGASSERTREVSAKLEGLIRKLPGVRQCMTLGGLDIATQTSNSNVATMIAQLKPWDEREKQGLQLPVILAKAQQQFYKVPEALAFAFGLPPILGLSTTGGFEFMLEDRAENSVADLARTTDMLVNASRSRPQIANVLSTFRPSVPAYAVDVDLEKVQTLGVPVTDAYNTLQTFLGGVYLNDFNRFGRTWQVVMQADAPFRGQPDDVKQFYVRNAGGAMVPLNTVADIHETAAPDVVYRYNRSRAVKILGGPAPGFSSGDAAEAMEKLAAQVLPAGYAYEWTGTTYQQKLAQGHEGAIFGFAAVLVFLFLAALYESWTIPFAVVAAVPLGIFGALFAVFLRSYPYDIYTQIGIVTLIGLAAKNAILIVEFAKVRRDEGVPTRDAAMEAARLRLRPILMTSFAFILGVVPLVIASGASSAARRSLGTAVFGGMNSVTLLAIFIVPVLYVVIQSLVDRRMARRHPEVEQ